MATKDDKGDFGAKLDIGIKAGLEAKLTTEIPKESSGRLLDSLTDIIRPFSEARGLRADQIRLQREEVLIEIAKLATRRLHIENKSIAPVPLKTLVPLLEMASLEDLSDQEMIERWAALLASSATTKSVHPRFVSILAELNGVQARLLEGFVIGDEGSPNATSFDGLKYEFDEPDLRFIFQRDLNNLGKGLDEAEEKLRARGLRLKSWALTTSADRTPYVGKNFYVSRDISINLDVLSSLNLIEPRRSNFSGISQNLTLHFYQITDFGIKFLAVCSPRARDTLNQLEQSIREERERRSRRNKARQNRTPD